MILAELKKILAVKIFIVLASCLILNGVIVFYSSKKVDISIDEVNSFINIYEYNKDEFETYCNEHLQNEDDNSLISVPAFIAKRIIDYSNSYSSTVDEVVFIARVNRSEVAENSYSSRYQNKLIDIYSALSRIDIPKSYIVGWDEIFHSGVQAIISVVVTVAVSLFVFTFDTENDMIKIIGVYRKGRRHLFAAKFFSVIIIIITTVIMLSGSSIVSVAIKGGLNGFNLPVQSLPDYQFFPADYSIGEFLLFKISINIFCCCSLAAICSFICIVIRSTFFASILSVGMIGGGYVHFLSTTTINGNFLVVLNPLFLLNSDQLYMRLNCVNIFDHPIDSIVISLIIQSAISTMIVVLSFALSMNYISYNKTKLPHLQLAKNDCFHSQHLIEYECKKSLSFGLLVVMIVILCIKSYVVYLDIKESVSPYEEVYNSFINEVRGPYSEKNYGVIIETRNNIDTVLDAKESKANDFKSGKITEEQYREYINEYWQTTIADTAFSKVEDYYSYVRLSKESPWITYDSGYNTLISMKHDYLLLAALILISYKAFFVENYTKMNIINYSYKHGTKKLFFSKIFLVIISSALISIFFSIIDLSVVAKTYIITDLLAPANSIMRLNQIPGVINISTFFILTTLCRIVNCSCIGLIIALIGFRFNSSFQIFLTSLVPILALDVAEKTTTKLGYFNILNYLLPAALASESPTALIIGSIFLWTITAIFLGITYHSIKERKISI